MSVTTLHTLSYSPITVHTLQNLGLLLLEFPNLKLWLFCLPREALVICMNDTLISNSMQNILWVEHYYRHRMLQLTSVNTPTNCISAEIVCNV